MRHSSGEVDQIVEQTLIDGGTEEVARGGELDEEVGLLQLAENI